MSLNQIKQSVDSILKLIEDSEKVSLPIFAAKLAKASEAYPEDYTLGAMANVTARMAGSNKLFITRAEVKDLYRRLYSRNTKFAELFSNELGEIVKLAAPQIYNRENDDESLSIINKAYEKLVDPALANALNNAFGNTVKTYTSVAADKAQTVCLNSLTKAKLAAQVDVVNGREDVVICRASFETPKGQTSVFVPVEITADKALLPTVFIGNAGPEDFTKENLEKYIVSNAGKKLAVSDAVVLTAISNVKDGDRISNVDLVLSKVNAEKETQADFSQGQILFQHLEPEAKNLEVSVPAYNDPEMKSFADQLESPFGLANFTFGKEAVETAKKAILNRLGTFGVQNPQISVFDITNDTVVYAVSANAGRTAFRVPVSMKGSPVPTVIISSGTVRDFSQKSIQELFETESTDHKAAAMASPLYHLKASELVDVVRQAVAEQNYSKAEDALNVLTELGDDKAYQTAFVMYTNGLNGTKQAETKCSHIVKSATSKHLLCGHTGLPLHKVYQDKNGDCHPLYRKGMDETYEGAYFLNSKIFF
jgi:hypothetical protein